MRRVSFFFPLIILLTLTVKSGFAAPLYFFPTELTQPDGNTIKVFLSGDEYYNWVHDSDNFTIVQDQSTGYYVYADLVNDELVATGFIVGRVEGKRTGLTRALNIPSSKMLERRNQFLRDTPSDIGDAPTSGTINNLVVYIRFSDESEFTDTKIKYDTMFNSSLAYANSMYNYFREVSYNSLSITSTFYPATAGSTVISYQDANPRGYYQPYSTTNTIGYSGGSSGTERRTREHTLLVNAVNYVSSQVSTSLVLDGDNDGRVDNVCFIVYGSPGAWADLLWPHRWALYSYTVNINGKRVYDYNFQLQTSLSSSGVGVLCHEMFHSLGAPDLYHYTSDGISPAGSWDIMNSNTNPPQHMTAYMKYRYGNWINNIPVISDGTYTLNPLTNSTGNCFRINSPNSSTEYFVVEYRLRNGRFENSLLGNGLLVYRINTAVDGQGNASGPPDELYIYRPNGTLTTNGTVSAANFSSNVGRTSINDVTNPSAFLSDGSPGGLNIFNIGATGETITFSVGNQVAPVVNFSSDKIEIVNGDTVNFYDNTSGSPNNWLWSFPGSIQNSSSLQNPSGIIYKNYGIFDVSLSASNSFGSDSKTNNDYIVVSNYRSQGFESETFPPADWLLDPSASNLWTRFSGASSYNHGSASAKYNFYSAQSGTTHNLISEIFIPTVEGDSLRIHHAYATYISEVDQLIIEVSNNGGNTFSELVSLNGGSAVGSGMVTAPPQTSVFIPTDDQWNSKTFSLPAGTNRIRFKAISAYGNNLYLDRIYIKSTAAFTKTLSLKLFIEGLLDPVSGEMIPDTILVRLRGSNHPYPLIDTAKGLISNSGEVILNFSNASGIENYYYQVIHRNAIETWSSAPVQFINSTANYDFTTSSSQAFGNNMILKSGKWCLYSGDIDRNGFIDQQDLFSVFSDNFYGITGYHPTDLNGDLFVESSDLGIVFSNFIRGIVRRTP
ncbi:MAG: M6 family metalloprotease domain-containing protein [Ignavibacteriales bacterium]|nr:MAG: M6 family metalloprotease domain-containing protein [Ignavibacteriales bacterium]